MLAVLATVVAAAFGRTEVTARVPDTVLQLSFEAPGFHDDAEMVSQLAKAAGQRAVFAGRLEPAGSTLSILRDQNQPRRTSEAWRKELGKGEGEPFEVAGIACRELVIDGPGGAQNTHYDAYVVAAGFVFDVHVATISDPKTAGFPRADFERLVESFRCVFVRYGGPGSLPREARDAMHRALSSWPGWRRTLDAELARKPGDAYLSFVLGELLLLSDAKPAEVAAAHAVALEGLRKLRTPSTEQRFAWMLAEQALGIAALDQAASAEALEHLSSSFAIAGQLRSSSRGPTAYALAQGHTLAGDPNEALRYLGEALRDNDQLRDAARRDRTFGTLAADKRFQALVGR
jgi:hypothetical protein